MEIIRKLRLGEFDVLVGINLLREGLDIPEYASWIPRLLFVSFIAFSIESVSSSAYIITVPSVQQKKKNLLEIQLGQFKLKI